MSKIIRKSNFRVVVEPKGLGDFGGIRVSDSFFGQSQERIAKDYEDRCKEMADQIRRHVDNVRSAEVDYDTEEICSRCGYTWELDEFGVPACCDKAIEEHESAKAVTENKD